MHVGEVFTNAVMFSIFWVCFIVWGPFLGLFMVVVAEV